VTALHLGCGKRYIPGFVHVDVDDFPHIDHKTDIADLHMFEDASIDLIYSSHALEYFDRVEVKRVLSEWRRVLRRGGTLRLAVPDFDALVHVYREYGKLDMLLGPLYGRIAVKTPAGEGRLYHKTVYDFPSMQNLLQECGFEAVRRYDWRQTVHRDYDDFSQAYVPHMDKEHGRLISLNVEATRS
jgi:predicted SAM-dependent methyltransferase